MAQDPSLPSGRPDRAGRRDKNLRPAPVLVILYRWRERRDILGVLAERLIREEVVEGAEVRSLVAQRDAPAVPGIPARSNRLAVVP